MNTHELALRLLEQGCDPSMFAIGACGAASDAFCLRHDGRAWRVYYTERGNDAPPIYSSPDEAQACEFFFRHMTTMRHDRLIGFFRVQSGAEALCRHLQAAGIAAWSDRIPYGGDDDPRFRVFVAGKDVVAAETLLGGALVQDRDA